MCLSLLFRRTVLAFVLSALVASVSHAQYRKLAPGVMTVIPASIAEEETFDGPREIIELVSDAKLDWQPNYTPKSDTLLSDLKTTIFRRQVWGLEFGFKPIRLINVGGRNVWYMVYYVKNNGGHKNPTPQKDKRNHVTFSSKPVNHSIRFFPTFVLESFEINRAYMDGVVPGVVDAVRRREDPRRKFYNSVDISTIPIKVSTPEIDNSIWGVAAWPAVDPRTDFFSVYVRGLTNAYKWDDPEGAFKKGDPPGTGRKLSVKTLQLNFWRPGDSIDLKETEFRYGLPTMAQLPAGKTQDEILSIYRLPKRVDHRWIYR